MIEIDGPPRAMYEDRNGVTYPYTVFAFGCPTPKECMDAYANWYREQSGGYIVWRQRAQLEFVEEQFANPEWGITYTPAHWLIRWRCHVAPSVEVRWMASVKAEGEAIRLTSTH